MTTNCAFFFSTMVVTYIIRSAALSAGILPRYVADTILKTIYIIISTTTTVLSPALTTGALLAGATSFPSTFFSALLKALAFFACLLCGRYLSRSLITWNDQGQDCEVGNNSIGGRSELWKRCARYSLPVWLGKRSSNVPHKGSWPSPRNAYNTQCTRS